MVDPMTTLFPKVIYERFCKGDPLSNDQLEAGIKHFGDMANLLQLSGPVFSLAACEAIHTCERMNAYLEARKERRRWDKRIFG